MKPTQYLIIGGGMTADAAAHGIRELDPDGAIGLIGAEPDLPYSRPPLSKGLWKGRPLEKIWRGTDQLHVDFHLGRRAIALDPAARLVRDDQGATYAYDRLLLATGGAPVHLPFGDDRIIYYRTLADYRRLRALSEQGQRFLVIGAGFIGSEIAAALTMQGKQVTMVFPENLIGERVFPPDLAQFLSEAYRQKGVELVPADRAASVEESGSGLEVHTQGGRVFAVDGVVAGIRIRPNIELAQSAGLTVGNGIVVDDHLRTSAPDIYAAGDVALFPHATLGQMTRVEHEDNALAMGRQAGRNMAGADEPYTHTPYFYSDLFEHGYEAVGRLSSQMQMAADWQEPFRQGVVHYLDGGRVRGVLLWNVWDKVKDATALLAEAGPFAAEDLMGRIRAA